MPIGDNTGPNCWYNLLLASNIVGQNDIGTKYVYGLDVNNISTYRSKFLSLVLSPGQSLESHTSKLRLTTRPREDLVPERTK